MAEQDNSQKSPEEIHQEELRAAELRGAQMVGRTVNHEFRNALGPIQAIEELLIAIMPEIAYNPAALNQLRNVTEAGRRMVERLDRFENIARLEELSGSRGQLLDLDKSSEVLPEQ